MKPRDLTLPTDSKERKDYPMSTGCDEYFPAALAGVARHSFLAGARHTPGQPMHHNRSASMDHADCIRRHMTDLSDMIASVKRSGVAATPEQAKAILDEANALSWRALAYAQGLHEIFGGAPLAPAARNVPKAEPACACCTCHPGACCCGKSPPKPGEGGIKRGAGDFCPAGGTEDFANVRGFDAAD